MQVSGALALLDTNYPKVYLGFETPFGSPGASPGTLASQVGVGVEIPLPCAAQVSNLLDISKSVLMI